MDVIGAVDIGGTKIAVGAVNTSGQVLACEELPTAACQEFQNGFVRPAAALETCLGRCQGNLVGIGIGCTGQIDPFGGRILKNEFLPAWVGSSLVVRLKEHFATGVAIDNDAVAAALAEAQ
jgi:glucokinase